MSQKNISLKMILILVPVILLILFFVALSWFKQIYPVSMDDDWANRKFILTIIVVASFTIIYHLIHLSWRSSWPYITINLHHHPTTANKNHELIIGSSSICSGCTGTSLGLLLAIVIVMTYIWHPYFFIPYSPLLPALGGILLIISLIRYIITLPAYIRIIQHLLLPISCTCLILYLDITYHSTLGLATLAVISAGILNIRNLLSSLSH